MNTTTQDNTIDGAIVEVKPDNALVVIDPARYATELLAPFNAELTKARRQAKSITFDITTTAGMATAREFETTFVKIRTRADKAKTEAKRPIDQAGKAILEKFNALKDAAEAEQARFTKAIKDEVERRAAEQQRKLDEERERVERLQAKVSMIRNLPDVAKGANSQGIADLIADVQKRDITKAEFEDYFEDAVIARDESVQQLRTLFDQAFRNEENERRIAEERAELARLRNEQEAREKAEREATAERERLAKIDRDAAAAREAESARQLAAAQAAQDRSMRLMEGIQNIQKLGMRDGDARALMDNIDYAESVDTTEERYGEMAGMAQMAKTMAVSTLRQKLAARLAIELPQAWDDAYAEKAQRETVAIPLIEEGTPTVLGVDIGHPDGDLTADWMFGLPSMDEVAPVAPTRPDAGEILDVLMRHFSASESVVMGWLRDLVMEQGL